MTGRVLLLSWGVPPATSGSAIVVANLAAEFSEQEMVVAGEYVPGLNDEVRPPGSSQIVYLFRALSPGLRGERWWRWLNLPKALWATNRLVRTRDCGGIVVVFPDELFLLIGYLISLWRGTLLFPYYHNTYRENRKGIALVLARWLEPRVLRRAQCVFVLSEALREILAARHPNCRIEVLPHPCREALPSPPQAPPGIHSPMRLILYGNINGSGLDAAARLFRVIRRRSDLDLTICSGLSPDYLAALGFEGPNIRVLGVRGAGLMAQIREADIVLLPHGLTGPIADIEIESIFPTKTIEALFSGRPILAHTPTGCFLTRFLRDHQCALIVDQASEPALGVALDRLREEATLRLDLVRAAQRTAGYFNASRVAQRLKYQLAREPASDGGRTRGGS